MFHLIIGPTDPNFLGLDLSLWLNAASIIVGVILAAFISPWLTSRSAKRDRQERLLRLLLHTWQTPANADYQSSIALIPLDFKGCGEILKRRSEYLTIVNQPLPMEEAELADHLERQKQSQAGLISAVAVKLDFDISPESLLAGAYISKGFVDREMLILNALLAWQRIATALELNNEMFKASVPSVEP